MKRFGLALLLSATAGLAMAQPAPRPLFIVFFPLWSGALDNGANAVIAEAASQLKQSGASATVTGYADSRGSSQANIYLTELRAQRVIDGLVADGVSPSQLKLVARGSQPDKSIASRRVEIAVSGP